MIIRSQDKKSIINFNEIDTIKCWVIKEAGVFKPFYETEIRYFKDAEYCGLLGEYSTEEKAIKVLDMIQEAYVKCEALKSLSSGTMVEVSKIMDEEQSKEFIELYKSNFVFEMPQDSEV